MNLKTLEQERKPMQKATQHGRGIGVLDPASLSVEELAELEQFIREREARFPAAWSQSA
jgi:hypothetical protein